MESPSASPVEATAFPKISLVGNPSDGYGGATLGLTISNFAARVTARTCDAMRFVDETERVALRTQSEVDAHRTLYGSDDASRLLAAAWDCLQQHCARAGVILPAHCCELSAVTAIPRQIGMGGSSAIVRAALDALEEFHGVTIPLRDRVRIAMDVETKALGIEAGLMDRVVQAHDGLIHLDCGDDWSATPLDPGLLPNLFIAWRADYAKVSSGTTLSPIAERFRSGEPLVRSIMAELASLANTARDALLHGERDVFLSCMDRSMDQRLRLMPAMDPRYRALIDVGRAAGSHVAFPGSGGAVVGSFDDAAHLQRLEAAYANIGATSLVIEPTEPRTGLLPPARGR